MRKVTTENQKHMGDWLVRMMNYPLPLETVCIGQEIDGELVAVTGSTVFVEDQLVIVHGPDNAFPDDLCPTAGGQHCTPFTAQGSGDTEVY